MAHRLPELPYRYDALEPYIDAKTMEIHHRKHHAAYVDNLNKALEGHSELLDRPCDDLLRIVETLPVGIRTAVRNNGGGHFNHSLFWNVMKRGDGGAPIGELSELIHSAFGSFSGFTSAFSQAALTHFGSGWAWLCFYSGELVIESTANQDNPLMHGRQPILGLDVWEHAYYLLYQNRRADYVEGWWNVINWEQVAENLAAAKKMSRSS
jgi:superoxide dismutase, Fe-Mn family